MLRARNCWKTFMNSRGDADPSLTYQVSGLKNGDTAGAVLNGGGLVRVSGENVGNYAIQQGGLGLVSGNYDLAYQGKARMAGPGVG